MPAVPFVMAAAAASGVAATIGTAAAALVGATITGAAATAIGAGVLSAGVSMAQGKSLSDSLKGAVIGGVASFVGANIASSVTSSIAEAAGSAGASSISSSLANVAGSMAGGAARAGVGAALSGQDPIEALIKGGLTAGLTTGIMEGVGGFTKEIPGFSNLKEDYGDMGVAAQRAISAGLASGILGKDVGDSVTQSLLGSFSNLAGTTFGEGIKDLSGSLRSAYDDANSVGTELQSNIDKQNEIVEKYNAQLAEAQGKQAELQEAYNQYNNYNNQASSISSDVSAFADESPEWELRARGRLLNTETGEFLSQEELEQRFREEANKYAETVNNGVPELEKAKTGLTEIESSLNAEKEKYAGLEATFAEKKAALEDTVIQFQTQEEANAQVVKTAFDNALSAKTNAEKAFGSELSQAQLDALIKTGDPVAAVEALIQGTDGMDEAARNSVFGKLGEGFDAAKTFAEEERAKPRSSEPITPDSVEPKTDVVDELLNSEAPTIQDTTGLDEGPIIPANEEPTADVVDQLLNSGMPSPDEDFVPTLPTETQTPTGPGYYDEITGEFIPDENGGLQGPLGPETGNFDPNQEWEYSLTRPGVWTNKEGEEIDLSYMPDRDTAMTGAELMERAGASPGAFRSGIRPPQGGGSGGAAPRPGGQPRPPVGGQPRPPIGGQPRPPTAGQPRPTTGGGAGGAGAVAGIIGGILGGGAGGVNAGDPRNPPASRNPAVDTIAGLASQQQQNSMLNMMMNDKSEGAKIKSYKELFGESLFGDTYVPPSARGYEAAQPQFQSQDDDIEQFFRGGDVTDINTLLQILRG